MLVVTAPVGLCPQRRSPYQSLILYPCLYPIPLESTDESLPPAPLLCDMQSFPTCPLLPKSLFLKHAYHRSNTKKKKSELGKRRSILKVKTYLLLNMTRASAQGKRKKKQFSFSYVYNQNCKKYNLNINKDFPNETSGLSHMYNCEQYLQHVYSNVVLTLTVTLDNMHCSFPSNILLENNP